MLSYIKRYLEDIMSSTGRKYRDDEIIMQLKNHFNKNSGISVTSFTADKKTCSVSTVALRFGSWENALRKAGIEPRIKLTKEVVIKQLKECYARNGRIDKEIFNKDKETCSSSHVVRLFSGWNKALEEAGLKTRKKYVQE
jgi:hypothetical protein